MKKIIYIFLIGVMVQWSCEKPETLSEVPEIKFKSVSIENYKDTLENEVKRVKLTISLVDGNGDIGLPETDYPGFEELDNKNLFITLYEKKDGEYKEVTLLAPHNYRTPYQEPEGQDKTLKADYEVTMDYSTTYFTYDTIKYSFFIYDRQKNKSNISESPEIPATKTGIIE